MSMNNYTTEEYTPVIVISKNSLELTFPWKENDAIAELFDKAIIVSVM